MEWAEIGGRIRKQREYLGYTREQFAELLEVTPKFCSDIELGVKGMSVSTLCKIAHILRLPTDFILFGTLEHDNSEPPGAPAEKLFHGRTSLCRTASENLPPGHEQ